MRQVSFWISEVTPLTQSPAWGTIAKGVSDAERVTIIGVVDCCPVLETTYASSTIMAMGTVPKSSEDIDAGSGASVRAACDCTVADALKVTVPPGFAVSVNMPPGEPAADGLN